MRRRDFLHAVLGTVTTLPVAAAAQRSPSVPTLGFLGPLSESAMSSWTAAFVKRLGELGWIDGRTIRVEYQWADGNSDKMAKIATEFASRKVDIIVTGGTAAVTAAKQATTIIPIVFGVAGDPVRLGLVTSLARPGGNVTGISNQSAELPGKRLGLLREIVPNLQRVGVLTNAASRIGLLELDEVRAAAERLGLEVVPLKIQRAEDIDPAMNLAKRNADALYVVTDPLLNTNRVRINESANAELLPTIHGEGAYVESGGLMSYGPNYPDLFRRAAEQADKILRGTKPGDIPVEQPTKFDLAINLKTAKALGIVMPSSLVAQADKVIE